MCYNWLKEEAEEVKTVFKHTWSKTYIENKQGLRLAALLCLPAMGGLEGVDGPGAAGLRAAGGTAVVVCHGFTGSKEGGGRALEMAEALAARGLGTLLFDFAGCGDSEGSGEKISLSGQIADLGCAVEWCLAHGFDRVVVNGRSFGGTTALCCAARDNRIAGVCTWAAVVRPAALFAGLAGGEITGPPQERINIGGAGEPLYLRKAFFYDLARHDVPRCAARLEPRPLLILHGEADETVPAEEARLLYRAAGKPKELRILKGADHRFSQHTAQAWELFFDWLHRHFAAK